MIRVGLLSDTHGYWDEKIKKHFVDCDEIWHAGDLGKLPEDMTFYENKHFTSVYGILMGEYIVLTIRNTKFYKKKT
jgi:hypothetical protein